MKKLNDKQLLAIVKTDIEAFNAYRKKNPDQKIEFTKLKGVNLKNCDLDYANFSNMNLEGLEFTNSNMENVKLKESNISNCNFVRCILNNSDFRSSNANNASFIDAEAQNCDFRSSDIESAFFEGANLNYSDFRCVKAKSTCFKSARASGCDFREVNVELANFSKCRLHYSDFRNSNFNSYQKNDSFHSKKIVTGKEYRIDDWYEEFYYASTLMLDKDKKDEERERKSKKLGIYMAFPFVSFTMVFLYLSMKSVDQSSYGSFSWEIIFSLFLAILSGVFCLCTELSVIEDLNLTHYLDDLKI
jgi:hypothetical protein